MSIKKDDLVMADPTNAKSETVESANCCGRCIDGLDECVLESKEIDYQALYEAQTRAIDEALNEISIKGQIARTVYRETKDEALYYTMQGAETAYLKCLEILTNKLK